jgi:hypothetical protein
MIMPRLRPTRLLILWVASQRGFSSAESMQGVFTLLDLLQYIVYFNLLLGFFNLVPIFPLDGFTILLGLLPPQMAEQFEQTRQWGLFILLALLLVGSSVLGVIVYLILLRLLNAVRKHDLELIERYLGLRLSFVARWLSTILLAGGGFPQHQSSHTEPSSSVEIRKPESERVTVDQREFRAFLADNQALIDHCQKLIGRVDELENECQKLNSQLEESRAKLDSAEARVRENMRQTGEDLTPIIGLTLIANLRIATSSLTG